MLSYKKRRCDVKKYWYTEQKTFLADGIDALTVSRDLGYEANHRNGREKHSFIYVQSGSLLFRFTDRSLAPIRATAGDVVFIPQRTAHTTLYDDNGTLAKIVQFLVADGELPDYLKAPVKLTLLRAGELIDAFFVESSPHPLLCLSLLYQLLWRVDRDRTGLPVKLRRLQPALDDIRRHPNENRKIADYAALCDMSEANFRRLFREYTGQSPIDYRNRLRLEKAHLHLSSGEYNVSEAAELSGFSNLSFFIRLYKRHYGCTPKNG